jgi:acyl dehydratase
MSSRFAGLSVGDVVVNVSCQVRRQDLIAYAGASGDLNPIHWSDRVARKVGLTGVIAHGMFTMGLAVRVVSDWVGDPARILSCSNRFTAPVAVPDDDAGARIDITATVAELSDKQIVLDLDARCHGVKVLGRGRVGVSIA